MDASTFELARVFVGAIIGATDRVVDIGAKAIGGVALTLIICLGARAAQKTVVRVSLAVGSTDRHDHRRVAVAVRLNRASTVRGLGLFRAVEMAVVVIGFTICAADGTIVGRANAIGG